MKRFPFQVCEVAEREFVTIQGRLAWVPDWLLADTDVDLEKLVARLQLVDETSSPVAIIRRKLATRLKVPESALGDEPNRSRLVHELNELLRLAEHLFDPDLLHQDAFARELAQLAKPEQLDEDERHQLNRMLLEAAFPAAIVARADTVRLGRVYQEVHRLEDPWGIHSALCLSGGGIRSASFALGVIQGLARCGLLERFDYLSTVSGGGYVGSWLSTWVHRHPKGLTGVVEELKRDAATEAGGFTQKLESEPAPIRFLRSYSHFLNPRAGLFSPDTWTWVGIYLRNLFLSWLALIPLLLLCLAVPRFYAALMFDGDVTGAWFPALFWLATAFAIVALICATANRPSLTDPAGEDRPARWWARFGTQKWILFLGAVPIFLFGMLVTLLAWDIPPKTPSLSWSQISALISATPFVDMPHLVWSVLPFVAFQHLVAWGELLVVVAWLASVMLIPRRGKMLYELGSVLLAGFITWSFVAVLVRAIGHLPPSPTGLFDLFGTSVAADHLYAVFAVPVVVLVFLAGMALFIGLVSKIPLIDDEDREWWARFGAWVLVLSAAWMAASFITVFGPPLLLKFPAILSAIGGASGLLAVLMGRSSRSPATKEQASKDAQDGKGKGLASIITANVMAIASIVFLAVFLALLSLISSAALAPLLEWNWRSSLLPQNYAPFAHACGDDAAWPSALTQNVFGNAQLHLEIVCQTSVAPLLVAMIVLGILLWGASRFINLNKFSLHAAYRMRIVRAFLGASRGERIPNAFTGFDPLDNLQMHELQPGLLREGDIPDLAGFATAFRAALLGADRPAAQRKVALLATDPRYDRTEVLRNRLEAYQPGHVVLKSLQRTLFETLNRVLEGADLHRDADLSRLLEDRPDERRDVHDYVRHDNRIFVNRVLLQLAFPDHFQAYNLPPPPPHKLMHVVNLTLNLVHGKRLAWQERKAAPFVVTPMHCGSYYLGYRSSREYGGREGISIGTAVAISGAAVSPNMGYSSSPVTALLLTLFNVRLGWWLGNPGVAGADTYARGEPRNSLRALLSEALGMTDDRSPYVYLSDGGHFENMALFEMVLRRCRLIVVSDAGADPNYAFEDLGNAVRKIRIDLGIPIEFTTMPIHKAKDGNDKSGRYCAVGRIIYSRIDGAAASDGLLICFKPVLCNVEPRDVLNYAAQHDLFPQEPTADQFFGESQFESYRQLGQFAVEQVLGKCAGSSDDGRPAALIDSLRAHLGGGAPDWEPWLTDWQKRIKASTPTAHSAE